MGEFVFFQIAERYFFRYYTGTNDVNAVNDVNDIKDDNDVNDVNDILLLNHEGF